MMSFAGFDQADFGKDGQRIIGHGWACLVRMESEQRVWQRFPGLHPGYALHDPLPLPFMGESWGEGSV